MLSHIFLVWCERNHLTRNLFFFSHNGVGAPSLLYQLSHHCDKAEERKLGVNLSFLWYLAASYGGESVRWPLVRPVLSSSTNIHGRRRGRFKGSVRVAWKPLGFSQREWLNGWRGNNPRSHCLRPNSLSCPYEMSYYRAGRRYRFVAAKDYCRQWLVPTLLFRLRAHSDATSRLSLIAMIRSWTYFITAFRLTYLW